MLAFCPRLLLSLHENPLSVFFFPSFLHANSLFLLTENLSTSVPSLSDNSLFSMASISFNPQLFLQRIFRSFKSCLF
jgi:hypothetical protein